MEGSVMKIYLKKVKDSNLKNTNSKCSFCALQHPIKKKNNIIFSEKIIFKLENLCADSNCIENDYHYKITKIQNHVQIYETIFQKEK